MLVDGKGLRLHGTLRSPANEDVGDRVAAELAGVSKEAARTSKLLGLGSWQAIAVESPDGNVYLHWECYRNPYYACSTYFAHPFLLKAAPESAPPHLAPPPSPGTPSFGPHEQPVPSRGDLGLLERTPTHSPL